MDINFVSDIRPHWSSWFHSKTIFFPLLSSFMQDVLVNVTDLSHPQFYAQRTNVQHVLEQLRLSQAQLNSMITVLNKADKVYVHDSSNSKIPGFSH